MELQLKNEAISSMDCMYAKTKITYSGNLKSTVKHRFTVLFARDKKIRTCASASQITLRDFFVVL